MKKFFQSAFVAALILSAGAAQAQLSAGHILLTGSAGYHKNSTGDDNGTTVNSAQIVPQVGYFVADNLAIGVFGDYRAEQTTEKGGGKDLNQATRTDLLGGIFARYYKPTGDKAAFFGQLDAGVGMIKDKSQELEPRADAVETKYNLARVGVRPGFTYFPTEKIGLEVLMGGLEMRRERQRDLADGLKEEDFTTNDLDARFNLRDLTLGFTWYFGGE